jgi:nucleotide-binding universal stress UspA family protein
MSELGPVVFAYDGSDLAKGAIEETAADGAGLAEAAGFRARSATTEAAPTWKGIVDFAGEHDASLIVLGSHGRSGIAGLFVGSVSGAVAAHCRLPVLITHRPC